MDHSRDKASLQSIYDDMLDKLVTADQCFLKYNANERNVWFSINALQINEVKRSKPDVHVKLPGTSRRQFSPAAIWTSTDLKQTPIKKGLCITNFVLFKWHLDLMPKRTEKVSETTRSRSYSKTVSCDALTCSQARKQIVQQHCVIRRKRTRFSKFCSI